MKKLCILIVVLIGLIGLTGCQNKENENMIMEMNLDKHYDDSDPFVNARLFQVKEDVKSLEATVCLEMDGESGTLEIKENKNGTVLWSKSWHGNVKEEKDFISLADLKKHKDYAFSFTGTKIKQAKIAISFDNKLVQELERPSN